MRLTNVAIVNAVRQDHHHYSGGGVLTYVKHAMLDATD